MESLLTQQAIGTITSRVMDNQGQNSQKLDIQPLKIKQIKSSKSHKNPFKIAESIRGYINRKKNNLIENIMDNSYIPKQSGIAVKVSDKVIVTNKATNNMYDVLIDELTLLEEQTLTGFSEVVEEKNMSRKTDESDLRNREDTTADKSLEHTSKKDIIKKNSHPNRKVKGARGPKGAIDGSGSESSDSDSDGEINIETKENSNDLNETEATKRVRNLNKLAENNIKTSEKIRTLKSFQKSRNEVAIEDVNKFNSRVEELFPNLKGKIARNNGGMYDLVNLAHLITQPDYVIENEKVLRFKTAETTTETSTNYNDTQADYSILTEDRELFKVPSRKEINKLVKNKKVFSAYTKLLNYLKCKTFLKFRDASLMQQLVHQANVWMVKEGYDLTDGLHYTTITNAVTVAFLISTEELTFRQSIKNKTNWDNMLHHNKTISGDLGKVFRLPNEASLFSEKLDTMALAKQTTNV